MKPSADRMASDLLDRLTHAYQASPYADQLSALHDAAGPVLLDLCRRVVGAEEKVATKLERPVVRQTEERDHRTGRPLIVALQPGGRVVRMKVKGARTWYTLTYRQMWLAAAQNRAAEVRAERQAKKDARGRGRR